LPWTWTLLLLIGTLTITDWVAVAVSEEAIVMADEDEELDCVVELPGCPWDEEAPPPCPPPVWLPPDEPLPLPLMEPPVWPPPVPVPALLDVVSDPPEPPVVEAPLLCWLPLPPEDAVFPPEPCEPEAEELADPDEIIEWVENDVVEDCEDVIDDIAELEPDETRDEVDDPELEIVFKELDGVFEELDGVFEELDGVSEELEDDKLEDTGEQEPYSGWQPAPQNVELLPLFLHVKWYLPSWIYKLTNSCTKSNNHQTNCPSMFARRRVHILRLNSLVVK
jgi:hypothetical protein